jgi:hypothetical protein
MEEMLFELYEIARKGDDMTLENNQLLNGFLNFGGTGGGFNLFKKCNSDFSM